MTADQRKEANIDIKLLEVEIENLEKELSDRSELFAKNFIKKESYEWTDIKKTLAPNEVAVEIVKFRTFYKAFTDTIVYVALIVTPETKSTPEMVVFGEGKDMDERWLRYYRNCMKFNLRDKNSYAHYWKPIREKIPANSLVYLSADGVYNQINLETIPTGEDKYVIDENAIVLVSNTRDLITRKQELEKQKNKGSEAGPISNKVALFGNPLYYSSAEYLVEDSMSVDSLLHRSGEDDRKVNQLPGAEKEVRNVDSLIAKGGWNSVIYLNENATEQKIKELNNIKVFHIATHGFFKENDDVNQSYEGLNENRAIQNPLLTSGLLLKDGGHLLDKENVYEYNSSDGILTAYEAMNLNFDNCELVVLSACETGLGKVEAGEGVFGLQRAFLVAGAKTVIMSLFKVNDEVTQELMTEFYKRWIASGDKRKSFLDAKKVVKQKYQKPVYWGSFIMIGIE
jgi:CHAT domain-containing protein